MWVWVWVRVCFGGQMEEKVFVAKLVRSFTFTSSKTMDVAKMSDLILRPYLGLPVRAVPRRPVP